MKQVTIGYGFWWECTLEVNEEIFTQEVAKSYLEFFVWDWNKDTDDYRTEYYKKIAERLLALSTHLGEYGVHVWFKNEEGYPSLDSTSGIKLIDFDEFNLTKNLKLNNHKISWH